MNEIATPRLYPAVLFGSAAFVFLNFGLPVYTRESGASATAIGGLYTVFTLTLVVLRPLIGRALDRFGRRWFFLAAFAFYCAAMLLFAQATNLADFYLARFVQGLGAALMWVSARTIIADAVAVSEMRGAAMGRLTASSVRGAMIGALYGFTLLGFLPLPDAWQLAFLGYAALALIGLLLALRVPETRPPAAARTEAEGRWFTKSLGRLFLMLFCTAFATALVEPIYLILLKDRFALELHLLALAFFPAGIVWAVLPVYGGRFADRFGRGRTMVLGLALAAVVLASLPWLHSVIWVATLYTLTAVGWSLAGPAEDALLSDLAPADLRGRVFGYRELAAGTGAALGPLLGGALYDHGAPELPFAVTGVVLLSSAGLAWHWFGRQRIMTSRNDADTDLSGRKETS